jgi:hypothetical protein
MTMEKRTNFYLKLLDLFAGPFWRMGVDYDQLRSIVGVKLTMDQRRTRTGFNGNEQQPNKWGYAWTLVVTMLISSFVAVVVLVWPTPLGAYSVVASYAMILIIMTLITDFSQVILDSSDSIIILPRPVSNKTLVSSRLVHVVIYLTQLSLASLLPAIIATFYKYGLSAGLVLTFMAFLIALLSVILTMILYLVIMQFATEERLRNIINGIQIVMVVVIMVGYQVVLRVFDIEAIMESNLFEPAWWHLLVLPLWVGNIMHGLIDGVFDIYVIVSILLLLVTPLLSVRVINSRLANRFSEGIGSIDTVVNKKVNQSVSRRQRSLPEILSGWFCATPAERGSFEFVWKVTARDRKFKLRVYPSLAYFLVLVPTFFMNKDLTISEMITKASESDWQMVFIIYFSSLIISSVIQNITYLDQYKAAWIYRIAPMAHPGEILSGSLWAMVVKFMFPAMALIGAIIVYLWGMEGLDDLLFGTIVLLIVQLVIILATKNHLPFSQEFTKNSGGQFVRVLLLFFGMALVGFGHWAISQIPFVILGLAPFLLWLLYFLNLEIRKLDWNKIN